MPLLLAIVGLLVLLVSPAAAQEGESRRYLPDSSDEDWSFLKTAPKTDVWDPIKYIPIRDGGWFMTLSGEGRIRAEGLRMRGSGGQPGTIDNYLLQRYLTGVDVRAGPRARVFAELQSGIITGAIRSVRPTDRNTLDLHQGFFEWRQSLGQAHRLAVKIGRQELSVGSTRLISASPALNVKRSFDGASVSYRARSWTLGGAAARLVGLNMGAFDDRSRSGHVFWGVAAGHPTPGFQRGELAAYYLGVDRVLSRYVQGIGPERRHTAGVKWAPAGRSVELNYDALMQWGTFGGSPIRAWAVATETAYRVTPAGWRPRVSVRADIASGDRDPAGSRLESFNPLFPGNAYSGAVGLLGPTNLTDLTPALTLAPRSDLIVGFEAPSYWRTSAADGVYATDLRPIIGPDAGSGRYIGTNPGILVVWQATRHWQLQGVVTRFLAGPFLRRTFAGAGFGFYSGSAVYRF